MCPVSYTSQGSAYGFCDNGIRNRGCLWPGCRKQWPDGGGNSLNCGESAGWFVGGAGVGELESVQAETHHRPPVLPTLPQLCQ